jgi:hypothetical protein
MNMLECLDIGLLRSRMTEANDELYITPYRRETLCLLRLDLAPLDLTPIAAPDVTRNHMQLRKIG